MLPRPIAIRAKNERLDYRRFIDGVLWIAHNRAFWTALPDEYGSWRTVYMRHVRWCRAGTWIIVKNALGEASHNGFLLKKLLDQYVDGQRKRRHERICKMLVEGVIDPTQLDPGG